MMVLFTKYKAIGAFVLAVGLASLPVMAEHKPDAVFSGLKQWLWLIYPATAALLLYTSATLGYFLGQRGHSPLPAVAASTPQLAVDPEGQTLDDLIYAARTITNALLEDGELREGAIISQMPRLERQHRAWHDPMRHQARDDFLSVVRRAMQARERQVSWMAGPGPHYGDFAEQERDAYHAELRERRDNLVMVLETLKAVWGWGGGGQN